MKVKGREKMRLHSRFSIAVTFLLATCCWFFPACTDGGSEVKPDDVNVVPQPTDPGPPDVDVPPPADEAKPQVVPPKGYALAIGLNSVNPDHYAGWSGKLTGCEPDVDVMEKIAKDVNYEVKTLKTKDATRENVLGALREYSKKLIAGDELVISYSGHGGQVPDENGDEKDGLDETWCLYDGELLDDEFHGALSEFTEGVRILVLSDSCHSGTYLRMLSKDLKDKKPTNVAKLEKTWNQKALKFTKDKKFVDKIKVLMPKETPATSKLTRTWTSTSS
jgi:hypothetical protein